MPSVVIIINDNTGRCCSTCSNNSYYIVIASPPPVMIIATEGGSKKVVKSRKNRQRPECHSCRVKGHVAANCPTKERKKPLTHSVAVPPTNVDAEVKTNKVNKDSILCLDVASYRNTFDSASNVLDRNWFQLLLQHYDVMVSITAISA
jgi:hypothetical protein